MASRGAKYTYLFPLTLQMHYGFKVSSFGGRVHLGVYSLEVMGVRV